MKMEKILSLILILNCVLLVSCGEDEGEQNQELGKLSVSLEVDITSITIGRVADVNTEDFVVLILNEDNTEFDRYDRAADLPSEIQLPTGNYKVVTHSNNDLPAAFENPYYYGETLIFSINPEETTSVTVTASLANVLVTVEYSSDVINSFDDYTTIISNSNDQFLIYDNTETRGGYFRVDPLTIKSTLSYTRTDGSTGIKTFVGSIANPQPQTHYKINIDASLEDGELVINIVLDESLTDIDVNVSDGTTGVCAFVDGLDCMCYIDADGDGYGSTSTIVSSSGDCAAVGGSLVNTDCDDTDVNINPEAIDISGDGIDQNCDGLYVTPSCALFADADGNCLCYEDQDNDGHGSMILIISADGDCSDSEESLLNTDCDDQNSGRYPGNIEIVGDGIDNNCDGITQ